MADLYQGQRRVGKINSGFGLALAFLLGVAWLLPKPIVEAIPLQGRSEEHGHHRRGHEHNVENEQGKRGHYGPYFGAKEIETIRSYYGGQREGLPPGLAKRHGNLPPGLEKHLERDGTLPPGLQKRLSPIPYSLERELPPLPRDCGCRRGVLGPDVLIMNSRTGRILDIVRDVLAR